MDALEVHLAEKGKARRTRNALAQAKARAYRNAKIVFTCPDDDQSWEDLLEERESYVLSHYRNRRPCSCWRCGNPRRYWCEKNALSVQERISLVVLREQVTDLN